MKPKFIKSPGHFVLPADAKISNALILTKIYLAAVECPEERLVIDANNVFWVSPFTACWFAALKDSLAKLQKRHDVYLPKRVNAKHQFSYLGIERYYVPKATLVTPKKFSAFPVVKLKEPSYPLAGDVTRILSEKLKGVENFHKALHFAIREIIENTFEHGQTDHCYMCAYSVPSKQIVRLCILDTGIGIPASMRLSKKYSHLKDDLQAVEMASEYGISSKSEERGIGLYLLRDVAQKNEAVLTILSGHAKIDISLKIAKAKLDVPFFGTAVELKLRTRQDFRYLEVADWEKL